GANKSRERVPHRVDAADAPERKQPQRIRKHEKEDDPEPEDRHRVEEQARDDRGDLAPRASEPSEQDSPADPDEDGHDRRGAEEEKRGSDALADLRAHRPARLA